MHMHWKIQTPALLQLCHNAKAYMHVGPTPIVVSCNKLRFCNKTLVLACMHGEFEHLVIIIVTG